MNSEMLMHNNDEGPSSISDSISSMFITEEAWEGLDDISIDMAEEVECDNEDYESNVEVFDSDYELESSEGGDDVGFENSVSIANLDDILNVDLKNLSPLEAKNFQFASLEVAYKFYFWFARFNGFCVRKSGVVKNKKGEILQKTFVCYRQGFREDRGLTIENRKRYVRPETRCGCKAKFTVHVEKNCDFWYITYFLDDHNHELLLDKHCRLLPRHRTLSDSDILHLNNMRAVGISTPHIYASLANQCGGYDQAGYCKKDLYNQSGRQRKKKNVDAKAALQYLSGLKVNDPLMFFRHTVNEENQLQNLFWCDGIMQMDYKIFGDVLAFDATYGKNKYECPIVIFFGVNHHNMTVVFAAAIVGNETEETYVWILEQFLEAMKGKCPISVITDGDLAMKNSIRRVFPNAYHRLCAWHLLRNAKTNICNPAFKKEFRRCMLGDYEIGEVKKMWGEMIRKFHVEDHPWVIQMYEKRRMWCSAYIRGTFFAGFRTTSRCEALHSQIAKFIYSRYNLTELLQHFNRCLNYMRYREVEADFGSLHGEAVLLTHFRNLEKCAANVFTKEIFDLFRPILDRCSTIQVVGCKESFQYFIYTMTKYGVSNRKWNVSFVPSSNEFKCSCRRMESFGLPCDHILKLLIYLNISELPKCLILKRWTKLAKEDVRANMNCNRFWGSEKDARFLSLMEHFKEVSVLAADSFEEYSDQRQKAINEHNYLLDKKANERQNNVGRRQTLSVDVNDPNKVRSKGSRSHDITRSSGRRPQVQKKCSTCRQPGHNKRSCPTIANHAIMPETETENSFYSEEEMNDGNLMEYGNDESAIGVEMHSFQATEASNCNSME